MPANEGYEAQLWLVVDTLWGTMNEGKYNRLLPVLNFLKYISDPSERQHAWLQAEHHQGAARKDKDEYSALNTSWVLPEARLRHPMTQARQAKIGQHKDDAVTFITRKNATLKKVLTKYYACPALDKHWCGQGFGQPIDITRNILSDGEAQARGNEVCDKGRPWTTS